MLKVGLVKDEGSKTKRRTTVRFTEFEFNRIMEDAKTSGLSLPKLLKISHFGRQSLKLLFNVSERHTVCAELRSIGNNVSQMARRVNCGALEGWHFEFTEVVQKISELHKMASGAYGVRLYLLG